MGQTRQQRTFSQSLAKFAALEWSVSPLAMSIVDMILHSDEPLLRYCLRRMRAAEIPNRQAAAELRALRVAAAGAISRWNPGETVQS
jgi:hypothetical protein